MEDCNACLELNEGYFKAIRTRGRVYLAQEQFNEAISDFEKAFELAPAGSADETALKSDIRDAKARLRRSKMKVRFETIDKTSYVCWAHLHRCLQDHYKILGVTTEATEIDIKKVSLS